MPSDLRHTLRAFRRTPGFAAVVILTFALGIGANVTMFGLLDRMLFRAPPHVAEPGRVFVVQRTQRFNGQEFTGGSFSYPSFDDLRKSSPAIVAIGATARANDIPLGRGAGARSLKGLLVTEGWFETMGVAPALGRFVLPDEARAGTAQPVVVISHGFWQRHFAGASDAIGRTLDLGMRRYTVVGVAPEGFNGTAMQPVDVYLPVGAADGLRFAGNEWPTQRNSQWLTVHVRLRDGVAPEALAAPLTAAYLPGERERFRGGEAPRLSIESILPLQRRERRATEKVALLVGAVSLLVLVVAIANVANLLLARALQRQREIAVRLALGMPRRRLVGQLVGEALLIALAGGAAALLVATWGGNLLRVTLLGDVAWSSTATDARIVGFLALVSVIAGLAAGIVPAIQASRPALLDALRAGVREGGGQRARTRQALLVVQIALTVVLLAGTGLFVRSLRNVHAIDTGMQPEQVLLARLNLRGVGYTTPQEHAIHDDLLRRVRELTGVERAALATGTPFWNSSSTNLKFPGRDSVPNPNGNTPVLNAVTADFLAVLGARILEGRDLTEADVATRAPVTVVNRTFARHYWPGRSAIGECFHLGSDTLPCVRVVGVVADMKRGSLTEEPEAQYFIPLGTEPSWVRGRALFVRPVSGNPDLIAPMVGRALQGAAGELPYAELRTLYSLTENERRPWNLGATMFTAFGVLALVLSAVGLYGVMAYGVAQRTHEMGVRRALGAQMTDVLSLIVRQGVRAAAVGIALGLLASVLAGRFVEPHLYRTSPRDPVVLGLVVTSLLLVAVVASLLPGMRAARVSPMVAMRAE